tara:strand:+ start:89 stop:442 length:354 start_codon:yes stop_codon:yes gene_type:complete
MLEIAKADNIITKDEINIIEEILIDFFQIDQKKASNIINQSYKELEKAVDMFQYSNFLNSSMDYTDKLDLIKCIFEVGYSDGELHYLEDHYIKTISNILNIERKDIIKAKLEIKKYL